MKRTTKNHRLRSSARPSRGFFRSLRIEPLEDRRVLATLDLAFLGTAGIRVVGAETADNSGISVSNAGDVNGDGFEDFLIGARYGDGPANGRVNSGEAYLLFGRPNWSGINTIDLGNLGTAGVTIFGVDAYDFTGRAVSSAGDINGDGFDDILISGVEGDGAGNTELSAGESYIIFGKSNWSTTPTIDLANLGSAGVTFFGPDPGDYSSRAISNAGDVNGDGFDDLIIGAHYGDGPNNFRTGAGEAALIFGRATWPATFDLGNIGTAGVTFFGVEPGDAAGLDVSSAGDVNGDGFDDLLIGARYADSSGNSRNAAGDSYLVFGKADWSTTLVLDLANLGTAGVVFFGADINDYSGLSLSAAGDVNGDGFDDFLIGAVGGDGSSNGNINRGETYLIFGKASWTSTPTVNLSALGTNGTTFIGVDDLDNSGFGLSGGGDINGDGFNDLIIGARYADADGNAKASAGDIYVVFGRPTWPATYFLSTLGNDGITIDGAETLDYSGAAVSNAGDVDGDGFDDFLIGAPLADGVSNLELSAGETYLIFGADRFTSSVTHQGTTASETLTGNNNANIMVGDRGDDVLIGNGGADVLRGAHGNDTLAVSDLAFRRVVGGRGFDTLRLDASGIHLNLTTIADNRIQGIERIDITGTGINTLTLNALEVRNISNESNTLIVLRDGNDVVNIGTGWTKLADETIDGNTFEVFSQGTAILKVQVSLADLEILKTAPVSSVIAGTSFVYTVRVDNNGPSNATGVTVTDTLPAGLSFNAATSSGTCAAVGQVVTCNLSTITAGTNKTASIGVNVSSSVPHGTTITNTATVTNHESDPTPNDRSSSVAVTVNRQADVSISKTAPSTTAVAGMLMTFTVQVTNSGASDATGVTISDTLADGLTFDSSLSSTGCTAVGQVVTCNVGTVVAGTNATRFIAARFAQTIPHGTMIENTATVTSNESDPTPNDHSSTITLTVNRQADLQITKTAPSRRVVAGSTFGYTVVVVNNGGSDATDVVVTDTLPTGLTFNAAASSNICSAVGQTVTCDVGALAATTNRTLTIAVNVAPGLARGTTLNNTVTVDGAENDPNPANQISNASVTVILDPDPFPWQNAANPLDVNDDGFVTPIDVLQVINELNLRNYSEPNGELPIPAPAEPHPFVDVSGDNFVVPNDALIVINFLNSQPANPEGEGSGADSATTDSEQSSEQAVVRVLESRSTNTSERSSSRRTTSDTPSRSNRDEPVVGEVRERSRPSSVDDARCEHVETDATDELDDLLDVLASDVSSVWQ